MTSPPLHVGTRPAPVGVEPTERLPALVGGGRFCSDHAGRAVEREQFQAEHR
jgi:hypothetical protein